MGNNLDLVSLLGLPKTVICPRHKGPIDSNFDDYDVECGEPSAEKNCGLLTLDCYCHECDLAFAVQVMCKVVV